MAVTPSAYRHGVCYDDMVHAVRNAVRVVSRDSDLSLFIGGGRDGDLLEVVIADPDGEPRIIHAMRLRRAFYRYLDPGGDG